MRVLDLPAGLLAWCIVFSALLGAAMGSFLHCAAWRIARGERFTSGRSRCPECSHPLGVVDLVPLLSWLWLRGRCRHCGAKIPVRYFLAELAFAALTVGCLLRFDISVLCLRNWGFLCCLFLLSLVDLEIREIPDGSLIAAAVIWLAALPFLWAGWADALLHLAAGLVYAGVLLGVSLLMDRILGKESLGGGDVKLLAVIGLYLGFLPTLFAVILACVLGLLQALISGKRRGTAFPFGPALSAGAALMLFFGSAMMDWYLGLFL
ncbi:MAG: prepilin peptidase [Ruminococcaceae bacterium]|nr:prepilin peptidase [Oscillospiraceae bacterium]